MENKNQIYAKYYALLELQATILATNAILKAMKSSKIEILKRKIK
jgi:hypothetical protein